MNFSSILFSGVAILVCMNSFVTMERVATCDINEHWTATMRAMKRCNSNIKNYYNEHEDQPLRYRYCKGMKVSCKARQSPALNYAEKKSRKPHVILEIHNLTDRHLEGYFPTHLETRPAP